MDGLMNIIEFASESTRNLLTTCGVFLAMGITLSIPISAIPRKTVNHNHVYDRNTLSTIKEDQ